MRLIDGDALKARLSDTIMELARDTETAPFTPIIVALIEEVDRMPEIGLPDEDPEE